MDRKGRPLPEFELDERKSRLNKLKHGIDFVEAQAIWLDPRVAEADARHDLEPRHVVIGVVDGRHWSAVITYRGGRVRLISVRRSRAREVGLYGR
jgi:uncharacterized DUF497 family protein